MLNTIINCVYLKFDANVHSASNSLNKNAGMNIYCFQYFPECLRVLTCWINSPT